MADSNSQCEYYHEGYETRGLVWYFGLLFLTWIFFKIFRSIWKGIHSCFIADIIGSTVDWKNVGKWAVVTGATDGIGKAYAKALAAKGLDIVLLSRSLEKLKTVAEEIEKKYKVKTQIIAVDFTDDSKIYDAINDSLQNLEIGVLVNNVGISYKYAEYLTKIEDVEKFGEDLIRANIISCVRMTHIVLSQMERRRKGVIINISSLSALSPLPLYSMYSASKVHVDYFTRATQEEYRMKGIIIQSVCPGYVATNMSKMKPSLFICTPEAFVHWAMKTVGVEDRTFGYPIHKIMAYVQDILTSLLPDRLYLAILHNSMGNIRKRYYRKFGLKNTDKSLKEE